MSLEDEVREAFRKHDDDAQPDMRSWNAVEKKVRRAHRQRVAYSSALSLVIIAAIAAAVTLSPRAKESKGFSNPTATPTSVTSTPTETSSASPSPSPTSPIPVGWTARVGVQAAFALAIPADWKGGWFEGTWDFEPKVFPGGAQDGPGFVITITVEPGNYDQYAKLPSTTTSIQGNRALVWHPSTLETDYAIEWFGCPGYTPSCSSNFETRTLIVRAHASDEQINAKYSTLGDQVIRTIKNYDGTDPVHGTFPAGTQGDELSKALVRFMDARIEGIGADALMSSKAADFYNKQGGLYDLNGRIAVSYDIEGPKNKSDTAENFGVTMHYGTGDTRQELITVQRENPGAAPVIENVCTGCD